MRLALAIMFVFSVCPAVQAEQAGSGVGWVAYPPGKTPSTEEVCGFYLKAISDVAAFWLKDFDYELTVSAVGKSGPVAGMKCALNTAQPDAISNNGQEN